MKIIKLPDPIKCSCCGCEFEYDDRDVYESYKMTDGEDIIVFNVYVDCPICRTKFSLKEEIQDGQYYEGQDY